MNFEMFVKFLRSENSGNDAEEGEIPRKSRVDPRGIPEVSNSFLMRGDRPQSKDRISESNKQDKRDRRSETKRLMMNISSFGQFCAKNISNITEYFIFLFTQNRFGWSKRKVPLSRSGRVIKGRGVFVSIKCTYYFDICLKY